MPVRSAGPSAPAAAPSPGLAGVARAHFPGPRVGAVPARPAQGMWMESSVFSMRVPAPHTQCSLCPVHLGEADRGPGCPNGHDHLLGFPKDPSDRKHRGSRVSGAAPRIGRSSSFLWPPRGADTLPTTLPRQVPFTLCSQELFPRPQARGGEAPCCRSLSGSQPRCPLYTPSGYLPAPPCFSTPVPAPPLFQPPHPPVPAPPCSSPPVPAPTPFQHPLPLFQPLPPPHPRPPPRTLQHQHLGFDPETRSSPQLSLRPEHLVSLFRN